MRYYEYLEFCGFCFSFKNDKKIQNFHFLVNFRQAEVKEHFKNRIAFI